MERNIIVPLKTRVDVVRLQPAERIGRLFVPQDVAARERYWQARVTGVGPDVQDIKVGDLVMFDSCFHFETYEMGDGVHYMFDQVGVVGLIEIEGDDTPEVCKYYVEF